MRSFRSWAGRGRRGMVAVVLAAASWAAQASSLYSFGPDALGVGNVFTPLSPPGAGTTVGDGSVAFNGGLVYDSAGSVFYAIANDSLGASTLLHFSGAAPAATAGAVALGTGFRGGLALDATASVLWAISSDVSGLSTLVRMGLDGSGQTALGTLGYGYLGGLTYNADTHRLYAIAADGLGVQRALKEIDVSGGAAVVTDLFDLGDGSSDLGGGLAYDAADDRFYALANDVLANSRLVSFGLGGAGALSDVATGLGQGYVNAGLALVPGGSTVPEPPVLAVLLLAAVWARRRGLARPRGAGALALR